ncbi:MAG: DegV family protein [Clostridiales bacterium]|jgi:DegV family protein with EDD domain|nr:DegV family protein [Clostridiales bacterium]
MSILFCDSNCELWYDKVKELGLEVIKMPYTIDGEEHFYDMGENTDFGEFYARIRKGSIPVTSALNSVNYIEYFEPFLAKGEDILYITFSHKMSATFDHMEIALNELKLKYPDRKVLTVDTKTISMGAGLIVYAAAKKFRAGASLEETAAYAEKLSARAGTVFTVDDLNHLKRGGRLGGAAAVIGSLLGLKPMLQFSKEGRIENYAKAKGRKKSIEMLLDKAEEKKIDLSMPVSFIDADASDIDVAIAAFRARFGTDCELWNQPVGPVIGAHCGPGTLGLCFTCKE